MLLSIYLYSSKSRVNFKIARRYEFVALAYSLIVGRNCLTEELLNCAQFINSSKVEFENLSGKEQTVVNQGGMVNITKFQEAKL